MKTTDFDYHLPESSIAQTPAEPRDSSRLLVLNRESGNLEPRASRTHQRGNLALGRDQDGQEDRRATERPALYRQSGFGAAFSREHDAGATLHL